MAKKYKTRPANNIIDDVDEKKKHKKKQPSKNEHIYKMLFIIVIVSLIFCLIAFFTVGKVIANGDSTDIKMNFYTFLHEHHLGFFAKMIFGNNIPEYSSEFPPIKNSVPDNIEVLFAGAEETVVQKIYFDKENDGFSGVMLAINDPTKFSIGSSTQSSNAISEIFAVERAKIAFPFAQNKSDNVLITDGVWSSDRASDKYGFFGFDSKGIMHFGQASKEEIEALSLTCATEQANMSAILCNGVPCDFESSQGAIGKPSISVAQCSDGSVILLFLGKAASCRDITELLYRYSAVNAAIIYSGNNSGYFDADGTFSFDKSFENSEYSCVWTVD